MNIRQAFRLTYRQFRYWRSDRPNWGHPHCQKSDQTLFELAAQKTGSSLGITTVIRLIDSCIVERPDPLLDLNDYIFTRLYP